MISGDTTYDCVASTIEYLHDRPPHPTVSRMQIPYPPKRKAILEAFEKHLAIVNESVVSLESTSACETLECDLRTANGKEGRLRH